MANRFGVLQGTYNSTLPSSVYLFPSLQSIDYKHNNLIVKIPNLNTRWDAHISLGSYRDVEFNLDGLVSPTRSLTQLLRSAFMLDGTTQMDTSVRWKHTFRPYEPNETHQALKCYFETNNGIARRMTYFITKSIDFDIKPKSLMNFKTSIVGSWSNGDSTTPTLNSDTFRPIYKSLDTNLISFKCSIDTNNEHYYHLNNDATYKFGEYDLDIEIETIDATFRDYAINNTQASTTFRFIGDTLGTYYYAIEFECNNANFILIDTIKNKDIEVYKLKVRPSSFKILVHNDQSAI